MKEVSDQVRVRRMDCYLKFSGSVLDSLANFLIKVAVLTQSPLKKRDHVQPNLHPHQQLFLGPF